MLQLTWFVHKCQDKNSRRILLKQCGDCRPPFFATFLKDAEMSKKKKKVMGLLEWLPAQDSALKPSEICLYSLSPEELIRKPAEWDIASCEATACAGEHILSLMRLCVCWGSSLALSWGGKGAPPPSLAYPLRLSEVALRPLVSFLSAHDVCVLKSTRIAVTSHQSGLVSFRDVPPSVPSYSLVRTIPNLSDDVDMSYFNQIF